MFDEDRSDRIEAKELEYVLRLVFKERPNTQRVHECMQEFDVDGSGAIEFDEFVKMYLTLRTKPMDKSRTIKALFNKLDADNDGYLGFSEVKHFLKVELKDVLTDPITDDDVQKLMEETDKDGDHKISYREFCLMFARSCIENK